jgi:DNA-binding IclR family transcriptional regulator
MSKIVNRTLDFFEMFAAQKSPLSMTQMVKLLGIPMSSCFDVAQALEQRGYLYQLTERGSYYPTHRLIDVAQSIASFDPIVEQFESPLQALCDEYRVSAWIGKVKDLAVVYLLVCNSDHPLSYKVSVGDSSRSLYATSSGKALLGLLPGAQLKKALSTITFSPLTPKTILSKQKLLKDIQNSVQRGWFLNQEESVEDACAVSLTFRWNAADYVLTAAGSVKQMERILPKLLVSCQRAIEQFTACEF